jgi:polar amino acid transport system permease protein
MMNSTLSFWAEYLPLLLNGLVISLQVTGACLLIGIPLGLVAALLVQSPSKAIRLPTLAVVEVGRGAPALLLLQFAYFGLPAASIHLSGLASAIAALSWTTCAYTSEIIRAGLQSVARGQSEAAETLGFSRLDSLRYVIVPQGMRVAAPALLGFAIQMLQASSLCFTIALPELLSRAYLTGTTTFRYMEILSLAALIYAAICIPATLLVAAIERRLGKHAI